MSIIHTLADFRMPGVKRIALYSAAGLLPAAVWVLGCLLYFMITWPLEAMTNIRVPYNQTLMVRAAILLAITGLAAGSLIGFLRSRNDFGFAQKYLVLFAFGSLVPLLVSAAQYRWYLSDPSQFAFEDSAKTTIGRYYTETMRSKLAEDMRHTAALVDSVRAVLTAIREPQSLTYVDSIDLWKDKTGCRRFDLGKLSNLICVERETTASLQAGVVYNYWPIIREPGMSSNQSGFRVDLFFLTGPYRCPVQNDYTGGGGLNFLRHEQVDADKMRTCLSAIVGALDARLADLSKQTSVFGRNVLLPYWYFLSASLLAFVGSDFTLVKPVGFWPVMVSVGLAVFRYLYFAVLVAVFLQPSSHKQESS